MRLGVFILAATILWPVAPSTTHAQLGALLRGASRAARAGGSAARAGGRAARGGSRLGRAAGAASAASVALIPETRAAALFGSLSDDAARAALVTADDVGRARVLTPAGAVDDVASLPPSTDVYVDLPAVERVGGLADEGRSVYVLDADGAAHPIRRVDADGDGVLDTVVETGLDTTMDLADFAAEEEAELEGWDDEDEAALAPAPAPWWAKGLGIVVVLGLLGWMVRPRRRKRAW